MTTRILALAIGALALLVPSSALAAGQVKAGAAIVDGTYNVGSSAGQYASTRDGGYGDPDPQVQQIKNQASYGVQSRLKVRAVVIQGANGGLSAIVSDNHYIPQDALFKRTGQLLDAATGGKLSGRNLTMSVTHNHSSPSYSSATPGVWTFQDAFDFRFFDYYAKQNAKAILKAYRNMRHARMSATVSRFDLTQRNPMGPDRADDGTPIGFPRPYTDHDLSVIRFESIENRKRPEPIATIMNLGQHPEMLDGYDLISGEFPETMARFVDRTVGGVTVFTQNATGTSEVERDNWHAPSERAIFDHAQYAQMEWGARRLADGVIANVRNIERQRPTPDDRSQGGMPSYRDRFAPWDSRFSVEVENRWFPGPVSHPYPGVSSCRTDPALGGDPRVPVAGLPDCEEVPAGSSLTPVLGGLPVGAPGITTDDLEALGVPVPENYSAPSTGALEDTVGVHLQAIRLGDVLMTICPCEQWVDQSLNIKTRTDQLPGNEWLGYDPTAPDVDPSLRCTENGDGTYKADGSGTGTWKCSTSPGERLTDRLIQKMRAQINNDAAGWDDPTCAELGCGLQAESEPVDLTRIRGNYTHDDTTVGGGKAQTAEYARTRGYKLVMTVSMTNDYNGYIATYRDYMSRDHYRKALTGWGPHSSDYMATRLAQMGRALKGDAEARTAIERETDPAKAAPAYLPGAVKEVADQAAAEGKARAIGEAASAGAAAYPATLPDDGGSDTALTQPKDIERFDAATFAWDGGNNYSDNPVVFVERKIGNRWVKFADQSGEVPVTLAYPGGDPSAIATYRAGGQRWRWTASFEAFVSRFDLVDLRGRIYRATPAGEYRFNVRGRWRRAGKTVAYRRVSTPFTVKPWTGITVEGAKADAEGRVTFSAGPSNTIEEIRVRRTDRPPLRRAANGSELPVAFRIGPVDFPDTLKDPAATGARFLNGTRGYSGTTVEDAEHYCLDCRFRDWMDATGDLTATVAFTDSDGDRAVEEVEGLDGRFATKRRARAGETVTIVIRDAWGNTSGEPVSL